MARTDNLNNFLTDVADSIRSKTGNDALINASDFDSQIESIETGSDPVLQEKSIILKSQNTYIRPDEGYDALSQVYISSVTSSVDADIIPENIRQGVSILGVEGVLEEGINPSGTINISTNGTHNVSEYAQANVSVDVPGVPTKGIIINEYDTSGYATDITVVGITNVPMYFLASVGTNIGYWSQLTHVTFTDATRLNNYMFQNTTSIVKVYAPNTTFVGGEAFYKCNKLTTITLSDNLTDIEASAFANCESLTNFQVPSKLKNLGQKAFRYCSSLTKLVIPSECKNILAETFRGCSNLTTLVFEATSMTLAGYIMSYCDNIQNVIFTSITTAPSVTSTTFNNTPIVKSTDSGFVYVPDDMFDTCISDATFTSAVSVDKIKPISELPEDI